MGRKSQKANCDEFPVLGSLGLYAAPTKGDGNCLFRALSDQVYGDDSHHFSIRQRVIEYVKDNAEHFAAFVGEFGETFDQYASRLVQDGVYGGHIEIVGFADSFKMPVVIYQAETLYVVAPQSTPKSELAGSAHVAYHTWEHYSSVRKIGGPRSGPVGLDIPKQINLQSALDDESKSEPVPAWKLDIVMRSVPDAPEQVVRQMLVEKDYETVIEELLMKEFEEEDNEKSPSSIRCYKSGPPNSVEVVDGDGSKSDSNIVKDEATKCEDTSSEVSSNLGKRALRKKPACKSSRKEDSKVKRAEKRERVRAKKDKSKHPENSQEEDGSGQSGDRASLDARRIIHI